jgi:hypothetical protein
MIEGTEAFTRFREAVTEAALYAKASPIRETQKENTNPQEQFASSMPCHTRGLLIAF